MRRYLRGAFSRPDDYCLDELTQTCIELVRDRRPNCLNLVLPSLSQKTVFGGIATALRLFRSLRPHFQRARIIVLDESSRDFEAQAWPEWQLDCGDSDAPYTIVFLKQTRNPLKISGGDHFIATHWRTACKVKEFISMQRAVFPEANARFIYLIQDFEPGFYAWSSNYLLADSTYSQGENTLAVFNTGLLSSYFKAQGYSFHREYSFEPSLNEYLARFLSGNPSLRKERLILIYGRPSTPRNAFEIIVEGLREWSASFESARDWTLISLGESHRPVRLAAGLQILPQGKVGIEAYASFLSRASIGISLMASPHPSYPPLEMADFGINVITNRFANKDLSARSPHIVSLHEVTPCALAGAVAECCLRFEQKSPEFTPGTTSAFLGKEDEFPFAAALVADWQA